MLICIAIHEYLRLKTIEDITKLALSEVAEMPRNYWHLFPAKFEIRDQEYRKLRTRL